MYFITGVAGFIGFHVAKTLLAEGNAVFGIDTLNTYYDPQLKQARLQQLQGDFTFKQLDIANYEDLTHAVKGKAITHIVHLAAQAGVRHSIEHPFDYAQANLTGFLNMLEVARHTQGLKNFVYASSSSVYGHSAGGELRIEDPCNKPVSLYAATKKSGEMMAEAYAGLYQLPITGLRFFTVYGPWGRPDMAYYGFTRDILAEKPITVYAEGKVQRDFTYIDDIVQGVLAAVHNPGNTGQQRLFNLGNNHPETVNSLIEYLENALGKKALRINAPLAAGDVNSTYADISLSTRVLNYIPKTTLEAGLERFVTWYRTYHS